MRPKLPAASDVSKFLSTIDQTRQYTNFGELHDQLREQLAVNYSCTVDSLSLFSSCTTALVSLLMDYSYQQGKSYPEINVLIPAWSFVGTLQAPLSLGMNLYFGDIDSTGTLCMKGAKQICEENQIDLVIVVAPFGRKIDYAAWEKFRVDADVAVLVDAAAGFCSVEPTALPAAVSMHATKIFSTGEGGFVLSNDLELVERLRCITNFGLSGSRVSSSIGLNFKLSEFACAVGLASLEQHAHTLAIYESQLRVYEAFFRKTEALKFYGDMTPRTTANVLLSSNVSSTNSVILALSEQHSIQSRRWWGLPLNRVLKDLGFSSKQSEACPRAEDIAERVIGLPIGPDISIPMLKKVAAVVIDVAEGHMS